MATKTDPTSTLSPPVTLQQWGELEGPPYYELVDGRLEEKPDVALWHEFLLANLLHFLDNAVRERGLGTVLVSVAKLRTSATSGRMPDLFFIPGEQFDRVGKNYFKGIPPLVIEIISPTSVARDRKAKRREYARLGIGQYWMVDFPARRFEIYVLQDLPEDERDYDLAEVVEGEGIVRPSLFPGLEIPLASIWPVEFEHRTDD